MPRRNLLLIVATAIVSLLCYQASNRSPYGRYFEEMMSQIEQRYVKNVDRQVLFDAAIRGMMNELDENSAFIGRRESGEFNESLNGEFGGVGIELHVTEDKRLTVISPLVGTPAYHAGILAGDEILAIDGKSTKGFELHDAVSLIKGPKGEAVVLRVLHRGEEEPIDVSITRETIQVDSVLGDTRNADGSRNYFLEDHSELGYIRLTGFSESTATDLAAALEEVEQRGCKALILDLRYNPGGLLSSAVEICDMFIDQGTIVSIKGRNEELRELHHATTGGVHCDLPMVVLINQYSASASEIVAACLQDHGRAVVVGERSYGKGTVQNVIMVEGGRSMLKLTIADYWRPSNRNIHRHRDSKEEDEWGVHPNDGYQVKLSDDLARNIFIARQRRDSTRTAIDASTEAEEGALETKDPQLERAIEHFESKPHGGSVVNRAA